MDGSSKVMQCSEVWGGNDKVDRAVSMPGLNAWVLSRPTAGESLGGDIHYVSSCATGRITRILVADVAGHGQAVAELALRLRAIMRRYVNFVDQTRVVERINKEFAAVGTAGEFATALMATHWGPTGEVDITNAGHPPPLFFSGRSGRWAYLPGDDAGVKSPAGDARAGPGPDVPLGILNETTYTRRRLRLAPRDLLLFYTDALVETRDEAGQFLGPDRLVRLVSGLDAGRPEALVGALYEAVRGYARREALDDDATILLMVRNEDTRPVGSIGMGLGALREMGREVWDRVRGRSGAIAWPQAGAASFLGAWFDRFNRRG